MRDNSTHNTQTKILSGCQLYDPHCKVNFDSVVRILRRIETGCLTLLSFSTQKHKGQFRCNTEQKKMARSVNNLDNLLLTAVQKSRKEVTDARDLWKLGKAL